MPGTTDDLREEVRSTYAAAAKTVTAGGMGCCGSEPSCCGSDGTCTDHRFGPALYALDERAAAPDQAVLASLGCGNPTAVAELREGETVLDLGSGGGLDVILSARRVGETGVAYGVDMTDEMLELARANAVEAGVANVEFLKGQIEALPLPDASVDVVISNCVINLATDKPAVFREMARVLRPGGRIGVSDIVADDHLTQADRERRGSYAGCIAGALSFSEYSELLRGAGFEEISVEATHSVADGMHSAIVRAVLPAPTSAKEV
jgi:SAM-dependent methyltransferase